MIPIVPVGGAAAPSQRLRCRGGGRRDRHDRRFDQVKCTNCKTCYQDLSEIFEKTRIVVNGESREVGRLIPGALERVADPELKARIKRVSANCDAEIIR